MQAENRTSITLRRILFLIDNSMIGELHMITQKRLKEVLHYNPDTGDFTWLISVGTKKANSVAGTEKGGYIFIQIDKVIYRAHRIAWLYITGMHPCNIDHINHNGCDNKFKNLRNVSHRENMRNRTISKNNKSGVNGVTFVRARNKWWAQVEINGRCISLGYYADKFEAICARKSANNKYRFHKNHGATESA